MASFPFVQLPAALVLLRVTVACLFMAHAVVRLANGSIPQFGEFLSNRGLPLGVPLVWTITAWELAGSVALIANQWVRGVTAGFMVLLLAGIALIHAPRGWFVGEHGTGGSEYSVALLAALVVIAAADRPVLGVMRSPAQNT